MKLYIQLGFLLLLFCISSNSYSQTSFNVASHSITINGNTFDYSIGEMTLLTTERVSNLIVTQGFLQPLDGINVSPNFDHTVLDNWENDLKVYPNPSKNIVFIKSLESKEVEVLYTLYDAFGRKVMYEKSTSKIGVNEYSLNIDNYAAGTYYLLITKVNQSGIFENYSCKIQKTN